MHETACSRSLEAVAHVGHRDMESSYTRVMDDRQVLDVELKFLGAWQVDRSRDVLGRLRLSDSRYPRNHDHPRRIVTRHGKRARKQVVLRDLVMGARRAPYVHVWTAGNLRDERRDQ